MYINFMSLMHFNGTKYKLVDEYYRVNLTLLDD